ncbi:hypothetical protein GWK47_013964 [Chionoecetes opilio]|uniref:Uncharacterized protein n=1 Tax=Chionoecetes opilio TaxID=41210 RepID=A0A8J5CL88_CHIOP|nr:hypothetical protein GWK47_013964 [Chionoecetes opilio]
MSSKPPRLFPSGLTLESSNDSVIDGVPSFGFLAERDGGNIGGLVEFFATNDTASKLKDDALAFLKEALMSKKPNPGRTMKNFSVSPTCSSVVKGQPKPFRRPGALHPKPGGVAKAIPLPQLQMLEIPAVADWSREGRSGTSGPLVALGFCKTMA